MRHAAPLATLLAFLPVGAGAQGVSLAPYLAEAGGLPGVPALVGLAATAWTGPVGVRIGGAMDLPSSPVAPLFRQSPSSGAEAWQGDLDLVFDLGQAGLRAGNVDPRLFAGLGVHGRRHGDGTGGTIPVWSYGGGGLVGITDWLGLELEARYRMPHETDVSALPVGVGGGWEARAGLSFRLGGSRSAARPAGAGRSGGGTIRMGGTPPPAEAGARRDASAAAIARNTLRTADRHVGVPYVWGGNTPSEGFDCSGFVRYVFAEQGIRLPRVSRDQATAGQWLPARVASLAPGDLMFYAGRDGVINHVAIYAGNGRIIHSSSSGRGVRYDDLNTQRGRYYATQMVAARRVIPDGGGFLWLH
jgi:cell wall-associated NlpC family hydrolase